MRQIPAALKAHLEQAATTVTYLLRIDLKNGESHGLTTLDKDVEYDGITYSATNGFNQSIIATDTSFSVDNSETRALLSGDVPGITLEMVRAGLLDDAQWRLLLVNYDDLTMGHVTLDAGDIGEVRLVDDTVYLPELVSYMMRLRQQIGTVDSRRCRAIFGTPANTQTGCGVDAEALFQSGTVTAVDPDNPFQSFSDTGLVEPAEGLVPGRVEWLTGDNASARQYQVEAFGSGDVTLLEDVPFVIQVGDTFRIRPDCRKRFIEDCRDTWDNALEFKGEPLIPAGEGSAIQIPQGQT